MNLDLNENVSMNTKQTSATQFHFDKFPMLHTERCILRKATDEDHVLLLELYGNPKVVEFLPLDIFTSIEDAEGEISWYRSIFKNKTGLRWIIEDRDSGRAIGTCGFLGYESEHFRAELGYDLLEDYWGKGLMKEVIQEVATFGFEQIGLNKIEAKVTPENMASQRLLEKLGFSREGLLRQHEFEKGSFVDILVLSKLRAEHIR
ncbi:GNAT family protein [Paenibacillus turicensis]|uniref:GNAT family N-acetyltransferase n=1 Tax=Paenibacillus turicensis TaxID=160487 RepID=UPI003D274DBD